MVVGGGNHTPNSHIPNHTVYIFTGLHLLLSPYIIFSDDLYETTFLSFNKKIVYLQIVNIKK